MNVHAASLVLLGLLLAAEVGAQGIPTSGGEGRKNFDVYDAGASSSGSSSAMQRLDRQKEVEAMQQGRLRAEEEYRRRQMEAAASQRSSLIQGASQASERVTVKVHIEFSPGHGPRGGVTHGVEIRRHGSASETVEATATVSRARQFEASLTPGRTYDLFWANRPAGTAMPFGTLDVAQEGPDQRSFELDLRKARAHARRARPIPTQPVAPARPLPATKSLPDLTPPPSPAAAEFPPPLPAGTPAENPPTPIPTSGGEGAKQDVAPHAP